MNDDNNDLLHRIEHELDFKKHGDMPRAVRAAVFVIGCIFGAGFVLGWFLGRTVH